jgi:hypothetical protein
MECRFIFKKFDLAQLADGYAFSACGTMSAYLIKAEISPAHWKKAGYHHECVSRNYTLRLAHTDE